MTNIKANELFDGAFPNERNVCRMAEKSKMLNEDVRKIFAKEEIVDYRFYTSTEKKQIIYYIVEARDKYIAYKQLLKPPHTQFAFMVMKGETA